MGTARFRAKLSPAWKLICALTVAVMVASCARLPHVTVRGDNHPHPGVWRARGLPVQGIDVSRYQGRIDFERVRAAGMHFVFIKATEGTDYVDRDFARNWAAARTAGLPRAAYHFMYWCGTAAEQARWFEENVPNDPDALPPVLDVEWTSHSRTCRDRPSRDEAFAKVEAMLKLLQQYTGKLPIIYTDINFHRDVLKGRHLPNTFWLRSVAAEPHRRYGNRGYTFWQWTETGTMPGVRGEVDRSAFYGSPYDWDTFMRTGCDPRVLPYLGPQGLCNGVK